MLTAKRLSTFSLALVLAGFLGQTSWAQEEDETPVQQSFESIESSESSRAGSNPTSQDFGDFGEGVGAEQGQPWLQNPDTVPAS